jgi:hypothetical protein
VRKKRVFFCQNDYLTKTGSGQTYGKSTQKRDAFLQGTGKKMTAVVVVAVAILI